MLASYAASLKTDAARFGPMRTGVAPVIYTQRDLVIQNSFSQ